jgi:hypothetical protein
MFNVTLIDHLHLTFAHLTRSQQTHEEMAGRLARRASQTMVVEVVLLSGLVATTLAAVLAGGRWYAVTAAALAALALVTCVVYITANYEPRIHAHRWCAARLWLFTERYRALLSELQEGAIAPEAARRRRDALLEEVQSVYEHAPTVAPAPRHEPEPAEGDTSDRVMLPATPPDGHPAA